MGSAVAVHETSGLRERKKAETRAAIREAVLLRALQRGLDEITTERIAAEANVSVRTFHNYFGSKEEARVEAWRCELEVYVEALRDRPPDESILDSVEQVFGAIVARIGQRSRGIADPLDLLRTSVALPRQRPCSSMRRSAWSLTSSPNGPALMRRLTPIPTS